MKTIEENRDRGSLSFEPNTQGLHNDGPYHDAPAAAPSMKAKTRVLPNRAYRPMAMLRNATAATGRQYKRGQYVEAAADLRKVVDDLRSKVEFVNK